MVYASNFLLGLAVGSLIVATTMGENFNLQGRVYFATILALVAAGWVLSVAARLT